MIGLRDSVLGYFVERRLFLSLLVVPLILYFYEGKLLASDFGLYSKVMIRHQIFAGLYGIAQCISYEKNPIFGIGWNTFYLVYPEYNYYIQGPNVLMYHAHNLYLNILAEMSIPSLLSFLAVIVGHVITSVRLKGICSDKLHR